MQNLIGARILIVEPDILLAVHLSIEFEQLGTSSSVITPTLARARELPRSPAGQLRLSIVIRAIAI